MPLAFVVRIRIAVILAAVLAMVSQTALLAAAPNRSAEQPVARFTPQTTLIDLNTAAAKELEDLPGIGPAYAKRIILARPYSSVRELMRTGIPASHLQTILPLVTVNVQPPGRAKPAAKPRPAAAPAKGEAAINVNSASAEQLETLPGIGPGYAKVIIANRPYAHLDELAKTGIPASRLAHIRPLLTVAEKPAADEQPAADAQRSAPADAQAVSPKKASDEKPAAGAAPLPPKKGLVWANTGSKAYHVEGSVWYGRTKDGKWMTEEEALKAGYHKAR